MVSVKRGHWLPWQERRVCRGNDRHVLGHAWEARQAAITRHGCTVTHRPGPEPCREERDKEAAAGDACGAVTGVLFIFSPKDERYWSQQNADGREQKQGVADRGKHSGIQSTEGCLGKLEGHLSQRDVEQGGRSGSRKQDVPGRGLHRRPVACWPTGVRREGGLRCQTALPQLRSHRRLCGWPQQVTRLLPPRFHYLQNGKNPAPTLRGWKEVSAKRQRPFQNPAILLSLSSAATAALDFGHRDPVDLFLSSS